MFLRVRVRVIDINVKKLLIRLYKIVKLEYCLMCCVVEGLGEIDVMGM